ncbi:MAG: hypothetical protein IBX56_20095 [Methylomicrobium sp.]|nr:hypothetical protein [Methylomicrobium sp.]
MKERNLLKEVEMLEHLVAMSDELELISKELQRAADVLTMTSAQVMRSIRKEIDIRAILGLCNQTHAETLRVLDTK